MAIQRYHPKFERLSKTILEQWKEISPAIASDCMNRSNVMAAHIAPLSPGMRLCGQARTVTSMVGDNGPGHAAIGLAEPGEILVIDARGHTETAVWGGIMTRAAMERGIAGLVLDGAVRDAAEIRALGFSTFAAGICPAGPSKGFGGIIDGLISCAGCPVKAGDIILGDDDGVAVVPLERHSEILQASLQKIAQENATNAATKSGVLPADRFNLIIEDIV
ncbi:MAG: RraA family protein [SAR324 cluster bacterium]|nr:RraA family protein [SAR324 cluster bacterium]